MRIAAFASPREAIATLAARRGTTYAALSRMLGRDARYIARFVRDGQPAQLRGDEQLSLAAFFGVDPRDMGATDPAPTARERALARDRAKIAANVDATT